MQRNNQLTSPHQISPSLSLWCTIKSSVTVSLHCDSISLHTRDRFCPETVLRWLGPPSNVAVCETCSRLYYFVPSLLGLFLVVFHCFLAHHFQRTNNTCNSRCFFLLLHYFIVNAPQFYSWNTFTVTEGILIMLKQQKIMIANN